MRNTKITQPAEAPEIVDAVDINGNTVIRGSLDYFLKTILPDSARRGIETVPFALPVVHVWLARSDNHGTDPVFILQRRSDNHRLDKTVGGHISSGMSPAETVAKELSEEMGDIKTNIVASNIGSKVLDKVVDVREEALLFPHSVDPWQVSERHDRHGNHYKKPTRVHTYLGLYDGNLEDLTPDMEVDGFIEMPFSEIQQALKTDPEMFTPDVQELIKGVADSFISLKP